MTAHLASLAAPEILLIRKLAERLRRGRLELVLPDGGRTTVEAPETGPSAVLVIRHPRVARRFLAGGGVGFAESFLHGDWHSPDLATLLELFDRNGDAFDDSYYTRGVLRLLARLQHHWRRNSRRGSRRNIEAHYDLGNEFYAAWLDPTLTYSSALFESGLDDLEEAQRAKYRRLARTISLAPDQHVLEIGGGWGGFAITAAKEFGARVTSVTISREQHALASRRVHEAGLADRVEIRLADYRDTKGRFDRLASIEMLEAVGERFWPTFFERMRQRLLPGGLAGLQVITIDERYFESYRRNVDFIQKHVFPGGMLPSPGALAREIARAGLVTVDRCSFGASYARTLQTWNRRFQAAWPSLAGPGFDERFRRLWTYYLAYCEAGFRTGTTDVVQLSLRA